MGRRFHPWEGGEGKATTQYETALLELAKAAIREERYEEAKELLEKALVYPENLGEGKLEGTKDNHLYYYLGLVNKALGDNAAAEAAFRTATVGTDEPVGMLFYNDQPADMILFQGLALRELNEPVATNSRFYKLISYGEAHIYDEVHIPYFAVSYPDLLIFDDDLSKRNHVHCCYLMGLGYLGLGQKEKAAAYLREALALDPTHQKAKLYLADLTR